jgi:lysyl-tRNA synthetase class 1
VESVLGMFELDEESRRRMEVRAKCAWNWVKTFSPEDFRFRLQTGDDPAAEVSASEREALRQLKEVVERLDEYDEKSLGQAIYDIAEKVEMEPKDLFALSYRVLIAKEKGPRLAGFIMTVGREKVLQILGRYL